MEPNNNNLPDIVNDLAKDMKPLNGKNFIDRLKDQIDGIIHNRYTAPVGLVISATATLGSAIATGEPVLYSATANLYVGALAVGYVRYADSRISDSGSQ